MKKETEHRLPLIDFHSHILPDLDDGAETVEESIGLLKKLKAEGAETVVSTSHFYLQSESMESFLSRRAKSLAVLQTAIDSEPDFAFPKIIPAAEVLFTPSLLDMDCSPLCVAGTRYILIEMPYQAFSKVALDGLQRFIVTSGLRCVMAHIERYLNFDNPVEKIYEIAGYEVLCQMNAGSIAERKTRKQCLRFISDGIIHVLGTDTHNLTTRPPRLDEAAEIICKKISPYALRDMTVNAMKILDNADMYDILD